MTVRLRHVAAVNPTTPEFDRVPDDAEIPFVPLEAVWSTGLDTSLRKTKGDASTGYTRFRDGDIVVPKITPTFQADRTAIAANIVGGVAAGTTELHVVRVSQADRRYVRHLLSSRPFLLGGEAEMIGVAGQKRVPDDWLRNFRIPVTERSRQRAIADYLDAETARIDGLIEKKLRVIELLTERRAQTLSNLILGRDAGIEMISDPILGRVPREWQRRRLRHCVRITVGVVVNPSSYFVDEGIPFIHGSDVRDGWIDTSDMKHLSAESNRTLAKSQLQAGDVVVVRAGYPGRAAVVPPDLEGSNCASILILRKGPLLRPAYLAHFLNTSEARVQVALAQYGAAQEQINVSDIVDFLAPVPELVEQDRILDRVEDVIRDHDECIAVLARQVALLREHREALISSAVTGELSIAGVAA